MFAQVLAPERGAAPTANADWRLVWQALREAPAPLPAPFSASTSEAVHAFAGGAALRALDQRGRARIERLLPEFLAGCAAVASADAALVRVLGLLQAIAGRATYLALLDEQPAARTRVVEVFARSAWLAERVTAHPLLLDDLLDARVPQSRRRGHRA